MTPRRRRIKIDPELQRQLEAAKDSDQQVEAILLMRDSATKSADPYAAMRAVIKRVEDEVGVAPEVVNVLSNLGMMIVAAEEPFVSTLLHQPEFASAMANADLDSDEGSVSASTRSQSTSSSDESDSTAT